MGKKRIEFIDLAKGVCILLVVMFHCGGPSKIPGYELLRMPLYFVLSGLFFKDYGGFNLLAIKKTNKLIVPYLFFQIVPYIVFLILIELVNLVTSKSLTMNIFPYTNIGGIIDKGYIFNVPLWFLLALFWCNVIFYFITKCFKSLYLQFLLVMVCASIGYIMVCNMNYNLLYLDISLISLPFFYLGYILKRTPLLYQNKYDRYNIVIALFFWLVSFMLYKFLQPSLSYLDRSFSGLSVYIIASSSVMSILFLCKRIGRLPLISYVGRYSIVILCTHYLIRNVVYIIGGIGIQTDWLLAFVIVTTLCVICIPIFLKLIPKFVAQEDLIVIKNHC